MKIPEYKAQIGGGILLALFSILLHFVLIPWQISLPRQHMGISPRFYPELLAGLLFILAIALALEGWRMREKKNQAVFTFESKEVRLVVLTLAIISLQIIAFNLIGYLIPAILAMAVCMYLYGQRSWLKIVLLSVSIPVSIKLIFEYGMQVHLP